MLLSMAACSDSSHTISEGEEESFESPHTCVGASLRAEIDSFLDVELLAKEVESDIPALECFGYRSLNVIECIPLNSSCGFEPTAKAIAFEKQFRVALRNFDVSLENYPFDVVDECFCRAY